MPGIAFLCVANSARSQLAEAIARHLRPDLDAWSAGSAPSHVRPQVYEVLREVGIDARGLRAKAVRELPLDEIDAFVVLCAEEQCPVVPGHGRRVALPLPDPAAARPEEALEAYRSTRDELLRCLPRLLAEVAGD